MDLNSLPLPDKYKGYDKRPSVESFSPNGRFESSVQILHREREERRQRMKRFQIDNPDTRIAQPLNNDEGPCLKKSKYDRSNLPQGWLDCPKFGRAIGYIIPSKVPLDQSFNEDIPYAKRYSFSEAFYDLQVVKRLELGMVVDLTNTDRYYRASELIKRGLNYLKIRCQGRDAVPDNECVNTFVFEVAKFIGNQGQRQSKKYVFVHCTHGHNRTGYMIVHFMMRTHQSGSVFEALQRFTAARPPGIYKQHYIDALYAFYHETQPDLATCPRTPEWKISSDFDQSGAAPPESGDRVTCASENHANTVMMSNDDVLGDKIPYEQQDHLRKFCYDMLKSVVASEAKGHPQFPGSHPVSLDRDKLQLLRQQYYYASWKADGTRYMLLLLSDGCYLVDRTFEFRRVQMRFPCEGTSETRYHHYTLLDGEMIIDTDNSKQERRYLIYDMVAINGKSIVERPFCERWQKIELEIIRPRNIHRMLMGSQSKPPYRYDLEPFRVRRKGFWNLSTVETILKKTIPNLSHGADGLIFQGLDDVYVPKKHEGLLKWKYPEMNSIDFLFEISEDGAGHLYLYDRGKKRLMEGYTVSFGDGSDPSSFHGKLIECSWNAKENVWMYMRTRVDKSTPNDLRTHTKIMKSIEDNITQDVLLSEIDEIIRLPMYAERIKNEKAEERRQSRRG